MSQVAASRLSTIALMLMASLGLGACLATEPGDLNGQDPFNDAGNEEPIAAVEQAAAPLRFVYGSVSDQGIKTSGDGFYSQKLGNGQYLIIFTPPFSKKPAVAVTIETGTHTPDNTVNIQISPETCIVHTYDIEGAHNAPHAATPFSFIAVGP